MRFQPGKSGNPGGRPRILADIQALAREKSVRAIETLAKIMENGKAPMAARVAAANSLLDRGFGKPGQFISAKGFERKATDLTDEELMAIIAAGDGDGSSPSSAPY